MRRWVKRLGIGVLAIIVFIGTAGAGLYGVTGSHFRRTYNELKVEHVAAAADAGAVARGKRFVEVIGKCTDCHAANLQGQVMMDDPAFGTLAAANLTSGKGGVGASYQSDDDWVRSIRHGVRPDGRALIFMPSSLYYYTSDQDLGDVIAYLKSLPPQDNMLPAPRMGPIARALYASKKLPLLSVETIDHDAKRPPDVAPGVTVAYGAYLSKVGGCAGCHKRNFEGGPDPAGPPGSAVPLNLTPAGDLGKWTEQDFFNALRTGKRPDGRVLDSFMPWRFTAMMSDDEIRALWMYLKTLPPLPQPAK